jgi:PII-like signaling protein
MSKDVMIVRIYIHEAEHGRRTTLLQEVLNLLHDQQRVQGVTVFRGIAGFGSSGEVHAADMLRLSVDLPLVIEFFDDPPVAEAAIGLLQGIVPDGHIVHWPAACSTLSSG